MNTVHDKNENIHQYIIEQEYERLRAKQKREKTLNEEEEQQAITPQSTAPATLEELIEEETALMDEKNQLLRLKQEIEQKIHEQIERKKASIRQLKAEILEVKQECQTLEIALENSRPQSPQIYPRD